MSRLATAFTFDFVVRFKREADQVPPSQAKKLASYSAQRVGDRFNLLVNLGNPLTEGVEVFEL